MAKQARQVSAPMIGYPIASTWRAVLLAEHICQFMKQSFDNLTETGPSICCFNLQIKQSLTSLYLHLHNFDTES